MRCVACVHLQLWIARRSHLEGHETAGGHQRQPGAVCRVGHTWHGSQAVDQRLEQLAATIDRIAGRKRQARGQHVDRIIAAVCAEQRYQAARKQHRTDEQNASDRNLPDHVFPRRVAPRVREIRFKCRSTSALN
jgi:hypothetical protein